MDRRLYLTLLLFAATLLAIAGFYMVLSPFLAEIAWALCLAALTYVPYVFLRRRWGKPRLAALVMVLLTAIVILVPLVYVLTLAVGELIRVEGDVESWVRELRAALPSAMAWLDHHFGPDGAERAARLVEGAIPGLLTGLIARGAWGVVGTTFTTVMSLIIMFATQYFVYTEGPRLAAWVRGMLPLGREDVDRVFETLRTTTSAAVLGGVVVALVQGALGGVGYAVVGIEAPILWGLVTAFFSILPVGGAALIWGPMVIYLFAVGDAGSGWILLAWGTVAVSGIDNVLRPWLLRRTGSRVHPMLLFFAILSGIGLFGMSGIVFGPLLIAVLMTLATIYREHIADAGAAEA